MTDAAETEGTLLGGALRYRQLATGYRTGLEPVLLAAFAPARPGARVVEAGCGAGAGLLCLAHRVAIGEGVGIEQDPALASLAAGNFAANGLAQLLAINCALESWRPGAAEFDHALANPPWHAPTGSPSPYPGRRGAKEGGAEMVALWTALLAALLRPRGTLTMILPAALLSVSCSAFATAGLGGLILYPLWSRRDAPARLMLLHGVKGRRRGADRLLPGLVLHASDGALSEAAERILRGGEAIAA